MEKRQKEEKEEKEEKEITNKVEGYVLVEQEQYKTEMYRLKLIEEECNYLRQKFIEHRENKHSKIKVKKEKEGKGIGTTTK